MATPPATACETDVNTLRERINYLRGDNESLRERVATLESIAYSDDGAGGDGMRLFLENVAMKQRVAELLAYNQTRTDELAASVAQVYELQTKHQVACDTIERQRADIDTIRGYLDEMKKSCERTAQQRDGLLTAAQAVIDRWDTPLWKDVPATAEFINELRVAVARVKP